MRALHLGFWLHHPYQLNPASKWPNKGYFGNEADFLAASQAEFQPLLALLERNSQRYSKFHVSLMISGVWLEQAERWDNSLIRRVRKLVDKGVVSLVTTPYYHSMAAFYDLDELKNQVIQMREKLEQTFSVKSQVLAVPELCYHNRLAKWAEKQGFQAILAGDASHSLDWRSPNQIYEAKNCQNLRILLENPKLAQMVEQAQPIIMEQPTKTAPAPAKRPAKAQSTAPKKPLSQAEMLQSNDLDALVRNLAQETTPNTAEAGPLESEPTISESTDTPNHPVFSAKIFQKQLDLELLRGKTINLYFDSRIFAQWREAGIIGFFDEIIKKWSETPSLQLASADDLLKITPKAELSVKNTAAHRGEADKAYQIPAWWTPAEAKNSQDLYNLRVNILKTRDRDLYVDFAKLTATDYATGGKAFADILADLQKRLLALLHDDEAASAQDTRMMASTAVKVKIDHRAKAARQRREALVQLYHEANADPASVWDEAELDDAEAAIQVLAQRMQQVQSGEIDTYDDAIEAEVVTDDIWMDNPSEAAAEEFATEPDTAFADAAQEMADFTTPTNEPEEAVEILDDDLAEDLVEDDFVKEILTEPEAAEEVTAAEPITAEPAPKKRKTRKKIIIE